MKNKSLFFMVFIATTAWMFPLVARPLDKVIAFYQDRTDLSADFVQTVVVKSPHRVLTRKGRVYFKRPGKMRWDYKWPDEVYYVSDGTTFWAYDVDEEVVYKTAINKSNLFFAMKFMMNFKGIYKEFHCRVIKSAGPGLTTVELMPVHDMPLQKLEVSFKTATGQVVQTVVTDNLGNRSTIKFSNPDYGKIPDQAFVFKVPKGVPVQELGQATGKAPAKSGTKPTK